MQESLVYEVPRWTQICVEEFTKYSSRINEVIEDGECKIYNFDNFVAETYHRLYDREPNRLEDQEIKPENKIWIKIHSQMSELESFKQFSKRLNGDEFLAGIGTTAICSAIVEILPKPSAPLENPEIIRNQLRDIFEILNGEPPTAEMLQTIQKLKQKGVEARLACEKYADSIDTGKIENAIIIGIASAESDLGSIDESLCAFRGGSDGNHVENLKISEKIKLAQRIQSSQKLQAIAQLAGKKIALAAKMQRSKVKEGRTEIVGITTGNDLVRILPSELVKLTIPELFPIFAQGFIERSLLQREMTSREPMAKGPIVICLDSSGSMAGSAEIWSKAIALALLSIAVSQKRHCRILHFTGRVEKIDDFVGTVPDPNQVMDCIEKFYRGNSTSFTAALTGALDSIKQHEQSKKADVVLITDGKDIPSTSFIEQWQEEKRKHEFSCYGILIAVGDLGDYHTTINNICDRYITLDDLTDDAEVNSLFTI